MKGKNIVSIILGVLLIAVGIILVGNYFAFWNINLFFKGWWTLFIIVPSIYGLIESKFNTGSFLVISIGVILFLAARDIIKWSDVGKIFLPLCVIAVGFTVIYKSIIQKNNRGNLPNRKNNDKISNYTAVFSGTEDTYNKEPFLGANINAVFGGIGLNLKDAIIKEDVTISGSCVFGGLDLVLPTDVNVKNVGMCIFGGADNKTSNTDEKNPTVYIDVTVIFGGIDIK